MAEYNVRTIWLILSNFIIAAAWARVAVIALHEGWNTFLSSDDNGDSSSCTDVLGPATRVALAVSFLELPSAILKFTRSPIPAVLLFACTRAGVELLVAPMIPCTSWEHLLTATMWGIGDTVRFGCFALDSLFPGVHSVKSVRYSVGVALFPIGTFGEMMMVILAGRVNSRPMLYGAAALWPVFFYPMMRQLLKQSRKHFASKDKTKQIKSV